MVFKVSEIGVRAEIKFGYKSRIESKIDNISL